MMGSYQITTVIKTPQFINDKIFDYTIQEGILDTYSWVFEPLFLIEGRVGKHRVFFHNESNYLKAKIK
jgi:hypothetical protein